MDEAQRDLERLRAALDDCNAELCAALARRAALVREVAALKARAGLAPLDPAREEHMLQAVRSAAHKDSFDPAALERIFRAILAESRALVLRPPAE